jgi:hypothetical protein
MCHFNLSTNLQWVLKISTWYIVVKHCVLIKFFNVINVHLPIETIMKQFDIHDCFNFFYF